MTHLKPSPRNKYLYILSKDGKSMLLNGSKAPIYWSKKVAKEEASKFEGVSVIPIHFADLVKLLISFNKKKVAVHEDVVDVEIVITGQVERSVLLKAKNGDNAGSVDVSKVIEGRVFAKVSEYKFVNLKGRVKSDPDKYKIELKMY